MAFDTLTEEEKTKATLALCGFPARWDPPKNFLPSYALKPNYHVLHNIFTFNVYPRKGNHT